MSAPTMAEVLENAAVTASQRIAAADARWRRLAHAAIPSTRGEYESWWCSSCLQEVSDPSHAQTCTGVSQ